MFQWLPVRRSSGQRRSAPSTSRGGIQPLHAILQGTPQGAAAIRAAAPGVELLVNGVRLGPDPTPVLHGDKIQIGLHEILAVDSRRSGHTQLFDSGAFTDLVPAPRLSRPDRRPRPPAGGWSV